MNFFPFFLGLAMGSSGSKNRAPAPPPEPVTITASRAARLKRYRAVGWTVFVLTVIAGFACLFGLHGIWPFCLQGEQPLFLRLCALFGAQLPAPGALNGWFLGAMIAAALLGSAAMILAAEAEAVLDNARIVDDFDPFNDYSRGEFEAPRF